jgi:hypothetical protein
MSRASFLYIFVTSDRPDPYINSIAYAVRNYPLREIIFVGIVEHGYVNEGQTRASALAAAVESTLVRLADGRLVDKGKDSRLSVDDAVVYADLISALDTVKVSSIGIPWGELGSQLKIFSRDGTSMFDVTALKKNLLVDVVTLLIADGQKSVFSFELTRKPNYDERDLIHALSERDYVYRCLTDSRHIVAAQRTMLSGSISFRTLSIFTAIIFAGVLLIQFLYPRSSGATVVVGLATATAVATWLHQIWRK